MTGGIRVLVVDPDQGFFTELAHALAGAGFSVRHAGDLASARRALEDLAPDAVLVDERLPDGRAVDLLREMRHRDDAPVALVTALAPSTSAVAELVREGALDVLEKPLFSDRVVQALGRALEGRRPGARPPVRAASDLSRPPIIGESEAVAKLRDQIARVTDTPQTTVLIQGESGTGKELVARAIHFDGRRGPRPFMAINCAALNENILEAELFGYDRGAFTGANAAGKQGLFEAADGGSVFLDEVGETAPSLQAKLLRFLEESTFKRVGGLKDIKVDLRVIAATNRDLWDDVRTGSFRKDLFFRLNVMPIQVPPLRERRSDILLLAKHFLSRFAGDLRKGVGSFSEAAERALLDHSWPGNIRELRNVCEYAVIVCDGPVVEARHLALGEGAPAAAPDAVEAAEPASSSTLRLRDRTLRSAEEDLIKLVLGETRFNITRAARLLGINRSTLYHKMKSFGLNPDERLVLRRTV
jgi:two-component system, NtrC family, response regulator AtoC